MRKTLISMILIFSLVLTSTVAGVSGEERSPNDETCINQSVNKLKYGFQKLWIEHAWWTRSVIVSKLADLEDQENVLKRLLQNQEDIGNIIKPYYGDEAGNKLTKLLKEHIVIAGQIVDAAKKGDQNNVEKFNKEWFRNANEIIEFLAKANPNWPKQELKDMFYTHLQLTTDEVSHRLKKDWEADIRTADQNEAHLIIMGDFLTDGIIKQFPEKFK